MKLSAGSRLGPYEVRELLGSGGMGEVYLAVDTRLGRKVAIKTLLDAALSDRDARHAILREARAAAALTHPNVAAIYDVLELEGSTCIVMEHVAGQTLADRAARGRLPAADVVAIGVQLADGLAAAHSHGVIHRDLKPANVRLTAEGQPKILDFGIARALSPAGETTGATRTTTVTAGTAIVAGTPGYMAPEQMTGGAADARTDIFGLGATLYRLLTGRRPFQADNVVELAVEMSRQTPPDVRAFAPDAPPELAAAIMRALAIEPADRWASAAEFRRALERVTEQLAGQSTVWPAPVAAPAVPRRTAVYPAIAIVIVLAAGTLTWRQWRAWPPSNDRPGPPVVAVMPLENLSGDRGRDYLGAGIAETLSATLANMATVSVVSRSEIEEARRRSGDVQSVARALGASTLVTGGVQESGTRLHVTVNLTDSNGRLAWAGVYESDIAQLFELQQRVAGEVADRLAGRRREQAPPPTTSVEALADYWQGRALLVRPGAQAASEAVQHFQRALDRDPRFALAQAGLGLAYWLTYQQTKDTAWSDRAVLAAESAHALASNEPQVHYAVATIYRGTGRLQDAVRELRQALDLQPSSEDAHRLLGDIYSDEGRLDDAVAEYRRALAIRPNYWISYRGLGQLYLKAGRSADAIEAFRRITELVPDDPRGYQLLGNVYLTQRDLPRAADNYERAAARYPTAATYSNLGTVYFGQALFAKAAEAYSKATALNPNWATMHRNLADAYRRLGRDQEAAVEYAKAVELFGNDLRVNASDGLATAVRGICAARLGQTAAARRDAERAVMLAGRDPDVLFKSACAFSLAGDTARALETLRRALDLGYNASSARADDDLGSLRMSREFLTLMAQR